MDNIKDIINILTFEELYEILQGNNVNPRPSYIGDGWNNLNIVYILQHYSKPTSWIETLWGQLVAGLSGVLLLFFVVVLLYSIYHCGVRNNAMRRPPWWYFIQRTPSPEQPPPAVPLQPQPPLQQQIHFHLAGGGPGDGSGGGGEQGSRSPRHDNKITNTVPPLPPVYTPTLPEDSPEPVYYHVVHSAKGES